MRHGSKTLCSFRLTDTTRDELQECVDLVRRRDVEDGMEWMAKNRDRTAMLEMAVAALLVTLKKDREQRDAAAAAAVAQEHAKQRGRVRPATPKKSKRKDA